ncbi:biotin transporter BioY [Deinococcus sp. Marseille-Q6407]|uniref:biotin transporter BioY n=1 Tax=Deinococcus sp. Marseille-Q6407 TaxID=2969223 RepID=UPI0021C06658|nr:biotin transporter BioY [Deinococcus sp. Marseille-Q6407]
MTQTTHPTLAGTLAPAPSFVRDLLLVAGGALLVALFAQAEIPLQPVPITLQTLGVLLVGAALGWKRGFAALALYLVLGAAGLPVFAGGSASIAKFFGPTGGCLLSYPFAAAMIGWLVQRFGLDRNVPGAAAAMLAASVVIYAFGLPWLSAVTGMHGQTLLANGLYPFVLGDALKIGLAALLLPAAWAFARR